MCKRSDVGALILLAACLAGCWGPPAAPPAPPVTTAAPVQPAASPKKPPAECTASEVLQQLLATYRGAKTYRDQGVVRLAFRENGLPKSEEWPVAVAFERPGKLSLAAYQATVKCDGKELRAKIADDATHDIDGQIIARPAPATLAIKDLAIDETLYNTICSRLRRQPIQLELLLESGGLVSAFSADVACRKLSDEKLAGRDCYRIEVPSPGGQFVFWIDQADFLLRRLDYPAAALVPDLLANPAVSDVQLLADLRGAAIGGAIPPSEFMLDIPAGAKRMRSFVLPPQPPATKLLGQQPPAFSFADEKGQPIAAKDLAGKITVLVWWYRDNPNFQATLQQVALARQRLKDDPAVRFFAVATDAAETPSAALVQQLADWQAELPLARDLEAFGDKSFHIEVQPTIVVLDDKGRVQDFHAGGNPQLAEQLVAVIQRLKRGDDVAAEVLARRAAEQQDYEQLVAKGGGDTGNLVELPEAVIRRASEPKHLRLAPLWTCSELKSPGNLLLVVAADQPPRILVFEDGRTIAEVSADGKVAARHPLDLPGPAAATFGRTVLTKDGKRLFAVSAPLAPQLFLFDEAWKLQLAYPPLDQPALNVLDLALADVDEDGTPEVLAACVNGPGLVAVATDGKQKWQNRILPNVVSVVASQPDDIGSWALFITGEGAAGESGGILRINRFGRDEPPIAVARRSILTLTAARFSGAKQALFLGLAGEASGQRLAVGLTADFKEAWNYPLPAGVHSRPIEAITSSHILPGRQGEWWLAGPDGSVHVVSEEGEFFDSFHVGAVITGLAATRLGDKPVLLIATDAGLAAWEIAAPANAAPTRSKER